MWKNLRVHLFLAVTNYSRERLFSKFKMVENEQGSTM